MNKLNLVAFDLGASNGRTVLGRFDGKRIELLELNRFDNNLVRLNSTYHWDVLYLFRMMKEGLMKAREYGDIDAIGIDSWGVDYGLLDGGGRLLGNPLSYRSAVDEDMSAVHEVVSHENLFNRTGIASMNFNTVYQLYRRKKDGDPMLGCAQSMLLMPDLLGYFFTGEKLTEYTNATTTMLYDPRSHDWDWDTIRALELPECMFTSIDRAGSLRGSLRADIAEECGINKARFAAVGTHDTASAVAAIPGEGSFAFCSSGTWSLFGVETDEPILTDNVFRTNFSNEGTVQGGYRPLKNIMGLWLIQECRRDWKRAGKNVAWSELDPATAKAEPLRSIIDSDYSEFFTAGSMENKIKSYCMQTGQPLPETPAQTARCIYESLALKYRMALENLEKIKGKPIDRLNIVGGGIENKLLNQMAADATGRTVVTGPVEGASMGNLLMQAVALGELSGIEDVREVVKNSVEVTLYEPNRTQAWEDAYGKLKVMTSGGKA